MIGVLDAAEIDALLRKQWHAHLGCRTADKLYVVPISYAYDGNRLIGHTTLGQKILMMRENPEVCVQVEDIQGMTDWQSAILWGRFEELEGVEAADAMGFLIERHSSLLDEFPGSSRHGRDVTPPRVNHKPMHAIVYCIHITDRTGRYESSEPEKAD